MAEQKHTRIYPAHFTAWERAAWDAGAEDRYFVYCDFLDPWYGDTKPSKEEFQAYRASVKAREGK